MSTSVSRLVMLDLIAGKEVRPDCTYQQIYTSIYDAIHQTLAQRAEVPDTYVIKVHGVPVAAVEVL